MRFALRAGMVAALMVATMTAGFADSRSGWNIKPYEGFIESVDALVGDDAIDCGFLDRHQYELSTDRIKAGGDCVKEALHGKRPFKFGTSAPGSNAFYLLMRSKAGQLWTVRYSRWIANSHLHEDHINQTCANVMIDDALQIHGIDCKFVDNGALPTYVRPNPGH